MLEFDWSNIVTDFTIAFEEIFSPTSKKAHFDNVPQDFKVVDGARSKWSNLLLLDAIIYLLDNEDFNNASRRAFNQHQVLHECIMKEYQKYLYNQGIDILLSNIEDIRHHDISLMNIIYPWSNIKDFQDLLLNDPTAKSKGKYLSIIDLLTNHNTIYTSNYQIDIIIKNMIIKVLTQQQQRNHNNCIYKAKRAYHISKIKTISTHTTKLLTYKKKSKSHSNPIESKKLIKIKKEFLHEIVAEDDEDSCSSSSETDSTTRYSKYVNYNIDHHNKDHHKHASQNIGYSTLKHIVTPINQKNMDSFSDNNDNPNTCSLSLDILDLANISSLSIDVSDPLLMIDDHPLHQQQQQVAYLSPGNFIFDPNLFESPLKSYYTNDFKQFQNKDNYSYNKIENNYNRYSVVEESIIEEKLIPTNNIEQYPNTLDSTNNDNISIDHSLKSKQYNKNTSSITSSNDLTSLEDITEDYYNSDIYDDTYHDTKTKDMIKNNNIVINNISSKVTISTTISIDKQQLHDKHQYNSLDDCSHLICTCSKLVPFPIENTNDCLEHSIYSERKEFGHSLSIDYDGCINLYIDNNDNYNSNNNNTNNINSCQFNHTIHELNPLNSFWTKRKNSFNHFTTTPKPMKISKLI